jgi:competence ComEA-like helix-hairpin-helix protein
MLRFLINHLYFSRPERMGVVVLLCLCGLVYGLPTVLNRWWPTRTTDFSAYRADILRYRAGGMDAAPAYAGKSAPEKIEKFPFDPNTATADQLVRLGLSPKTAASILHYREKGGKFRKAEDFRKIYALKAEEYDRLKPLIRIGGAAGPSPAGPAEKTASEAPPAALFTFNPNTADEATLQKLGLAANTIKSIVNYRQKGGVFRKKEDLQKIYTLPEETYERLAAYIEIPQASAPEKTLPSSTNTRIFEKIPAKAGKILDVNQATEADWFQMPGFGEKRAAQMVRYKNALGGFLSIEQVGELYGLPDSIFQRIRPMLTIGPAAIHKINLNTATADELKQHPYFSYKQARLIVAYREQHGPFKSIGDIGRIAAFSDKKWLDKITPYLSIE